jgi:2-C-methyl-D-erythritol 2,4-cyclodiphosphate synthase
VNPVDFRIGLGRDLHRLVPGRPFLLGGVHLKADFGEEGHSDGDVLCHAVTDALLGAAGLGDIGEFFPPNEDRWKNACSVDLLKHCVDTWLKPSPWRIVNIDCVVSCEMPAVLPYRAAIRHSLARALGIGDECVFVKGKSGEGLGDIGHIPSVSTVSERYRRDAWAVLLSTILSLRTKDKVTLAANKRLLEKAPVPAEFLALPTEEAERLVFPAGFYRTKVANLQKISRILLEKYGGKIPADMDALLALPGVGRKTANLPMKQK